MYRILYVHGLGGGADSNTAKTLRKYLDSDYEVIAPEIPLEPNEAFAFIKSFVDTNRVNMIVASSLGAFYASMVSGIPKLLINPVMSGNDLRVFGLGTQKFRAERMNGAAEYELNEAFIDALNSLRARFEKYWFGWQSIVETYALFGTSDEYIHNYEKYSSAYKGKNIRVIENAHHSLTDLEIRDYVIPYIAEIANYKFEGYIMD